MWAIAIFVLPFSVTNAALPDSMRVATVQMQVTDDVACNLSHILASISEAKAGGAAVAVFPETALSGFSEAAIARIDWNAIDAAMAQVAEGAKAAGLYVIYGCATKSPGKRPYNSAIVLGRDGAEITRYHKLFPEEYFEPGDHLAFFEIAGVPATLMICHDERFPEVTRIPAFHGARVCFYISYEINGRKKAEAKAEGYRAQLIARAVENGIWVVQSNGVGPLPAADSVSLGQSHIVAPDGRVLQEAPALQEAMLVQDLAIDEANRGNVNETARNPILSQWYSSAGALMKPHRTNRTADAQRNKLRVGLMQGEPRKWDLDRNFNFFLKALGSLKPGAADIFVTPECWLDGYAAADKASTPERLRSLAQDPETSPFLRAVAQEAQQRKLYICFGFTSLEDGAVYNAAGLWNDKGDLIGIYHKTHLQTHDLQFAPGNSLPVWPSPWGPLGIMICADRRWPETARTLRLQGARIILNPTYGMWGESNDAWMRTRGYENQCFIAFAHPKISFVVDPQGKMAARRKEKPGVLLYEADLAEAREDNHLSDRRPELYLPITEPIPDN